MPYGRSKDKSKNVAAQQALLFGSTPKKVAPQTPPKGAVAKDPNFAAHRAAIAGAIGGTPKKAAPKTPPRGTVAKDPNFAANRAAIAGAIGFGGRPTPSTIKRAKPIPKSSGGKEFQNQKAALASKLNFRPPLPAGDPCVNPSIAPTAGRSTPSQSSRPAHPVSTQNGAQDFGAHRAAIASQLAFGKPKPASPPKPNAPPPRRNNNNNGEFTNQKAALAANLVFRPPLPASATSGGPNVSPPRPTTGTPTSPQPQQPRYSPKPQSPNSPGDDLAAQAAAIASRKQTYHPDDVTTTSSGQGSSSGPPSEPEMSFLRSESIRKENPPPAEPDMKYVRSYRIGGGATEPKEEPQVIPKEKVGDENGRVQVVLIRERVEWGTRPLKKKYHGNRTTVKRFTTDEEEERKRQKNKNGGGCSIM